MISGQKLPIVKECAGQIMVFALVFMAILLVMSTTLSAMAGLHARAGRQAAAGLSALKLAEAGVDKAIYELNQNQNFAGESNVPLGAGSFSTVVTTIDANNKQIISTGRAALGGVAGTSTVSVAAAIDLEAVSFRFGVQAGAGGVEMANNSRINGNIFANGSISGSGIITGDATVASGSALTADQSSVVYNTDFWLGDDSARADAAQSFVPSATGILSKARFFLKKTGSPSDLTIRVVTDNNGSPSKTALATGNIPAAAVGADYALVEGVFSPPPVLNEGQSYWLMLNAPVNSNKYYSWGMDADAGYATGTGKYSNKWDAASPVWTESGGDFYFQTVMGGVPTFLSGVAVGGAARAEAILDCSVGQDAFFESTNTCAVAGAPHPGTPAPNPEPFPVSSVQIAGWESAALRGGTVVGDYLLDGGESASLGPIKIEGNLTIDNNSTLLLAGPVWVEGNIALKNDSVVRNSISLGQSGAVLIADDPADRNSRGTILIENGAVIEGNGYAGSYPMLISMYSGGGKAFDVKNNTSSTILYAPYGTIEVSNNSSPAQLTANKIEIENNAAVNYTIGLQNALFASGPGGSWAFKPGTYVIVK